MKHFLKIGDYEPNELQAMLDLSLSLQKEPKPVLKRKNILFVFEKPSLRTKVGTEVAINHLDGRVVHVEADVLLGSGVDPVFECRESLTDTMKNVSQWCDGVFARVYEHESLQNMAEESDIPIINALCDRHHPMQAMADILTLQNHFGKDTKVTISFIGDANNVAYSLIEIALKFGHEIRFGGPEKYFWTEKQLSYFGDLAVEHGGTFIHTFDPFEAVKGSDVIYTDTFVSMGEEHKMKEKIKHFKTYQVNREIYSKANPDAGFMHCLPAHRGMEVTEEVIDHPNSWIYKQARNRMVVSKGIFATMLG
ncbi:MAG: ornithine carbamoyltransferase [Balneolaceae bacterium]